MEPTVPRKDHGLNVDDSPPPLLLVTPPAAYPLCNIGNSCYLNSVLHTLHPVLGKKFVDIDVTQLSNLLEWMMIETTLPVSQLSVLSTGSREDVEVQKCTLVGAIFERTFFI